MSVEHILPEEMRLNASFDEYLELIVLETETFKARPGGDVLDVDVELSSLQPAENLSLTARCIARYCYQSSEEHKIGAIYRAMVFAFQTAGMVDGTNMRADLPGYLTPVFESDDAMEAYSNDISGYLAENANVDNLIGYFIDEIDQGRGMHTEIELAAGMIFMLADRERAEQFIDDTVGAINPEDFEQA